MEKDFKRLCIFVLPCVFSAVVMRILMIENVIDSISGFFYKDLAGWGTALSVAVILLCALICVAGRVFNGGSGIDFQSPVISVLFFVLSLSVFYEGFMTGSSRTVVAWQVILLKVFGFAGAVTLVYFGICGLKKIKPKTILSVIPLLFFVLRIMVSLSVYSYEPTIADNMFDLFAICTSAIYFLYFFRLVCSVDRLKTKRCFLCVSALNFTACTLYSVPCILMILTKQSGSIHSITPSVVTDIAVAVFTAAAAVIYCKIKKPEPEKPVQIENFLYPENDNGDNEFSI